MSAGLSTGVFRHRFPQEALRASRIPRSFLNALSAPDQGIATIYIPSEEYVGGFTNWPNVQSAYGLTGNYSQDATTGLQNMLNEIGTSSFSYNMRIPAGDYRYTAALTLADRIHISILCDDAVNTRFIWDGASGGSTVNVNGVAYSRLFERGTFVNLGGAEIALDVARLGPTTGHFDTNNEFAFITFNDFPIPISGGRLLYGFSETCIRSCKFNRASKLAVWLRNYNALSCRINYCEFDNCQNCIGTNVPALGMDGYGGFRAFKCIFRNTVAHDISCGTSSAFGISVEDCYSIGAAKFFNGLGGAGGHVNIHRNTILDTKDDTSIQMQGPGPVNLFNNTIRSRAAVPDGTAVIMLRTAVPTLDGIAIDNILTVPSGYISGADRLYVINTSVVNRNTIPNTIPFGIPQVEPNLNRTIFEVASGGNVAAAVTSAAALNGNRPIVHLQVGDHTPPNVPANTDMQIVGDGYMTGALGQTILNGPTKSTIRQIRLDGQSLVDPLKLLNVDQITARMFLRRCELRNSPILFRYSRLDHLLVEIEDSEYYGPGNIGIQVIGGPLANAGTPGNGAVNLYSATHANLNTYGHDVSEGGKLFSNANWYEEANGPEMLAELNTTGRVFVTQEAGKSYQISGAFALINNLIGKISLLNNVASGDIVISGDSSGGKVLGAGFLMIANYLPAHDYFTPGNADAKLLNSREWQDPPVGGQDTQQTANEGTVIDAYLIEMLAHTRGINRAPVAPITTLGADITDARMFGVWIVNGATTGIDIQGAEPPPPGPGSTDKKLLTLGVG